MGSIASKAHDNHMTITGTAILDRQMADDLRKRLCDACENAESVTVDLRPVDFIDSSIESELAQAGVNMMKQGRRLKVLVKDGSQPCRSLKILLFPRLVDMEEEALG
jgi:anti-anti-sigma regulatory factor